MDVFDKVVEVLKELSGLDEIQPEYTLQQDLSLDSMLMVTLLIEVEEAFDIVLDESDMNPFDLTTVQNVVDMVKKYSDGDKHEENS